MSGADGAEYDFVIVDASTCGCIIAGLRQDLPTVSCNLQDHYLLSSTNSDGVLSNTNKVMTKLKICLVAWLAMATPLSGTTDDGSGGERKFPIVLSVYDDTAGTLRCSIILAHFVTQNPAPSNRIFKLIFDRDQSSGTLSERTSGGAMLVENILCGDKNAWQDTVSDIPLALLRSSQSSHFVAHCQIESRLRCRVRAKGL